jgi:hypothetical protein
VHDGTALAIDVGFRRRSMDDGSHVHVRAQHVLAVTVTVTVTVTDYLFG